jgi:hypothetical protein
MFGGPTSGNEKKLISTVHGDYIFRRTSPKPSKTFDDVRGASVEINSYNSLKQYMPGEKELPRLTVL